MDDKYEINIDKNSISNFIRIGYAIIGALYDRIESKLRDLIINEWYETFANCSECLLAHNYNFSYINDQQLIENCQRFVIASEKLKIILMSCTSVYTGYTGDIINHLTYMCEIVKNGEI